MNPIGSLCDHAGIFKYIDPLIPDLEGRPEVKGRIRSMQREMARRRMMEQVPKADVVVTNPIHYAVAPRYRQDKMGAPHVVDKGADLIAVNIRNKATEHGVTVLEAPPLARALFFNTEQYPNPYVSPELCFRFHYFAMRKLHFLLRAKALVAFPGGYGTFDELFETLTLVQTRKIQPLPVVLVGEAFWSRAFDVQFLVEEGVIDPEDAELFWYAETADEAWQGILKWHQDNGTPLF